MQRIKKLLRKIMRLLRKAWKPLTTLISLILVIEKIIDLVQSNWMNLF
jgi:hypothetical protein